MKWHLIFHSWTNNGSGHGNSANEIENQNFSGEKCWQIVYQMKENNFRYLFILFIF